ncbi:hypothetical protein SR84_11715 [Enterobacter hormaechei subsp. xiangfangensis]|nr:hypothetical protein SR84_11715 [Enterobacter hormaechei subsp. xiangfangensis]
MPQPAVTLFDCGKSRKPRVIFQLTCTAPIVLCILIVCLTLLIFTWLTRNSLCELRMKDGTREVSAILAYESGK